MPCRTSVYPSINYNELQQKKISSLPSDFSFYPCILKSFAMADLMVALDENTRQIPNVELANKIYVAEQRSKKQSSADDLLQAILEEIKGDEMADLYVEVVEKFGISKDDELLSAMVAKNKVVAEELETKIADAAQNAGDTEVS